MEAGSDQLAQLREELRLIGATDEARVRALATLKATQEANRMIAANLDPAKAADYVQQQVAIADAQQQLREGQDAYNASLTQTAEHWDIIAGKVQSAGQGMADAFGSAGKAIGDLASTYASYEANRARLGAEHDAQVKHFAGNDAALARENARYALQTSGLQIAAYGDMASAAKGFFAAGSAGYKAMATAEKVFRAIQFAMSIKAMVQNAAETASSIAKSGLRTAAHAVEAVVKAILQSAVSAQPRRRRRHCRCYCQARRFHCRRRRWKQRGGAHVFGRPSEGRGYGHGAGIAGQQVGEHRAQPRSGREEHGRRSGHRQCDAGIAEGDQHVDRRHGRHGRQADQCQRLAWRHVEA